MQIERREIKRTKTRRAIKAEAKAEARVKRFKRDLALILDGTADRLMEEYGINILNHKPPPQPSADGGAGRDEDNELGAIDPRSGSERLTDHIRGVLSDPDRQKERRRLKAGGSHDARAVPDEAPGAVSYPRVPWEER